MITSCCRDTNHIYFRSLRLTLANHSAKQRKQTYSTLQTKKKELYVSYHRHTVFYYMEHVVKSWHESSSPYSLTLIDRMADTRGRVVTQIMVLRRGRGSGNSTSRSSSALSRSPTAQRNKAGVSMANIICEQWDCDQVFAILRAFSVSLLDMATQQHSSALSPCHLGRL